MEMDDIKKLEFEKALELRNFEITNFWTRGWFFGALILATVAGYFANATLVKPLLPSVCISFLIVLFSVLQSLMNRGSKYWHERWEFVTKNRETELGVVLTKATKYNNSEKYLIDQCILAKDENIFTQGQRFSVTKLAFLVWDIICIAALFVWLNDVYNATNFHNIDKSFTFKVVMFHAVILIYIFIVAVYKGRVYENIKKTTKGDNDNHRKNKHSTDCENYINATVDIS